MKKRKWIKYVLLAAFLIFCGSLFILFQYVPIDFNGTLSTKYSKIENSTDQIIETDFFKIRTPKNWIHIFSGYGIEGDPYGIFRTNKGLIHYEYGNWAEKYSCEDGYLEYSFEMKTINRFEINIARNNDGKTGIYIPKQHEMKTSLTLYMDESVSNNFEEIVSGIKELEFK